MPSSSTMARASSGVTVPSSISSMLELFPLTHPAPTPATDGTLIPASDIGLEQDLLLRDDDARAWRSYIDHVVTTNSPPDAHTGWTPDANWSAAQVTLLGSLASTAARQALRRIVSVYERALARFPTNYSLWLAYLLARSAFVCGQPTGGAEAWRRRAIDAGRKNLDAGPSLLEEKEEDDWQWKEGKALDGRVGYKEWSSLAAAYERALMCLPKMPRIWLLYLSVLSHPLAPVTLTRTHARRTFDRCLRTLPPSLHLRIWKVYLSWAEARGGETCLRVWRRYLLADPSLTERFVGTLLKMRAEADDEEDEQEADENGTALLNRLRGIEAAKLLLRLAKDAGDGKYTSPEGKSPYQLLIQWLELCEKYGDEIGMTREEEQALAKGTAASSATAAAPSVIRASDLDSLSPEPLPVGLILRELGIARFPDQAGRLWTGLATYWIKRVELEAAHDVFEEGMQAVVTVRDFTQIFDAYAETSENVISYLMEELASEEDEDDAAEEQSRQDKEKELDARMKEFEELMERRPFLVNDVLLRRNPHDVQEWEKRVVLHGDDDAKIVQTYEQAIETINPRKATPNFHTLFINFAKFYELGGSAGSEEDADLDSARKVLEKATTIPFRRVDDLAEVWCEWAELEVRAGEFDGALRVLARATIAPKKAQDAKAINYHDEALTVQKRLFKSTKLWSFYVDLEESIGSVEGAKAVYDRILELKIATPQIIINYAAFLEENKYFEESFKVYERGVEAFTYPVAFELWNVYLAKFVKRYAGTKIERARDLFEQALEGCPPKFAKPIFLKYGALEEEHGLAKRAMGIYERATSKVSDEDCFDMYTFYIAKATANFGLAATRPIYERAIEALPDRQTAEMCLRFAALERKLGEIDRARAIYAHASQFCDPRTRPDFWKAWNNFEIETGSEDTFREMLRVKRAVQAQFNTDISYIAASAALTAASAGAAPAAAAVDPNDPMAQAEAAARAPGPRTAGFVAATTTAPPKPLADTRNDEVVGGEDDDDDLM